MVVLAPGEGLHPAHDLSGLPQADLDQRLAVVVVSLTLLVVSRAGPVLASATSWIQRELLKLHGPWVYVVVGALVLVEVGILIGFFVPGEIAAIIGGVVASQHRVSLAVMIVVVAAAATLGNLSGYQLGRLVGPWLLSHRPLKGHPGVQRTESLIARRGAPAVVIGRWIAVVRALLPGVVGMSGMDLRIFVVLSAVGGAAWAAMWVSIGFAVGESYATVVNASGQWSLVALGVVVVALVAFVIWRRSRERRGRRVLREGNHQR